jgi:ribosomal protein S27E
MSSVTAIRTRLTVCSGCGHHGRLVIDTPTEVISRCMVCGDELRTSTAAAVEITGHAAKGSAHPGA